jgi:CRP/FNR family transcriptional regulator, cyclic AMP receptor protein
VNLMSDDLRLDTQSGELALEKEAVAFFEFMDQAIASGKGEIQADYAGKRLVLEIPPLGEGDRSMVYRLNSASVDFPQISGDLCIKVAKQDSICRDHLLLERSTTEFFLEEKIAVPRIHYMDPRGRFAVKDLIEGESITSLYIRFDGLPVRTQSMLLDGLRDFVTGVLELFQKRPDCKVSISPNNIYLLTKDGLLQSPMQFVLIDLGPTPNKDYSGFNFDKYWNEILPERIRKYQRTGYLQWLVPREVSASEREDAKEFEIFRDFKPAEIFILLKIANTLEFDPGEVILKEGTIGENFYLILDGEIALRKGHYGQPGSWELKLGSGSVLGEMGFLLRVPRSMTAVAMTHCKLIEVSHEKFQKLLEANLTAPYKLLRNISIILAERLYKLDQTHHKLLLDQENFFW